MIFSELWYAQRVAASPAREMREIIETLQRNPENEDLVGRFLRLAEHVGFESKSQDSLYGYLVNEETRSLLLRSDWNHAAPTPHPGPLANTIYETVLRVANETNDPDWVGLVWQCWDVVAVDRDEWPDLTREAVRETPDGVGPKIQSVQRVYSDPGGIVTTESLVDMGIPDFLSEFANKGWDWRPGNTLVGDSDPEEVVMGYDDEDNPITRMFQDWTEVVVQDPHKVYEKLLSWR